MFRSSPARNTLEPKVHDEPTTIEDFPDLTGLVIELMELQQDLTPNREAQERGVLLILEEPSRGRIFVLRSGDRISGLVNLLFTNSIAV